MDQKFALRCVHIRRGRAHGLFEKHMHIRTGEYVGRGIGADDGSSSWKSVKESSNPRAKSVPLGRHED